ncbi:MAG: hypothetical protein SVX43_05030 [Cyanobacteriota bacterium]|nr:hypothetical protein [Cyanobacteriota bacterium]
MFNLAHIINVTEITESNKNAYLHIAQPVTMKSMIIAKNMAKELIDVELWAVRHKHESVSIPNEFRWSREIDKYAYEYIEPLGNLTPHKPLPRLVDIILSLYESSDADYFIYTNLDIGLYPDFYIKVKELILDGYDAFCINRRNLKKEYAGAIIDENKLELAFVLEGKKHPGIDCFVFSREIVPSLKLGNVYIGFPPVGQVLKTQIESNSKNFLWVKEQKLTFHLGGDKYWRKTKGGYASENFKQAEGLYVPSLGTSQKLALTVRIKNKLKSWLRSSIEILER